jgi:hypothetical protein
MVRTFYRAYKPARNLEKRLDVAARVGVFYSHVLEFTGFENLATFEALHKFGVFFTGHYLHTGMLTLIHFASLIGDWRRRGWSHNPGIGCVGTKRRLRNFGYFSPAHSLVKYHKRPGDQISASTLTIP